MAELVAGAFLSSSFQVIFEKMASVDIRDYFGGNKLDDLVKELDIKLNSINHVLEEAEIKQYQNTHVKKWHDELKHVLYDADQILDEIATDAMLNKMNAESEPVTNFISGIWSSLTPNPFESRINDVLENLQLLAEQKKDLGLEDRNDSGNQIPPIISIVGLGGMGKTTLAQLVYNDNKIKEHFQLEGWVYVSESFDVVGLTKAILESFKFSANGENLSRLQEQLQRELTGKKYLLVLDDIWNGNAECWEQLLLPFNQGTSGSKIIVTTREKEVADVLNSTLFDLEQLDKRDCWSLFVTHAFHGKNVSEYPNLESIGKEIVDKCGGLPLAVKTLGQLLRRQFSEHAWMNILETDMGRLSDEDNKVNPVLRLSYHNLPSNHKRCFAYCSLFPKGYDFDKGELIKFWMADGLLKCSGADKSEEELGNEIFTDLESISFFQKSFYFAEFYILVMHDLVNDLAKSVSGEFCMQIEGSRVEGIPERTRHILLSSQLNCGDKLLESICKCKGLRSLIVKRYTTSNNVQRDLFSRLTWLRMLSFRGCGLSELVDEIDNLKLLRYLDLSNTRIKSLPDTICMLYNLQTLLLERCVELTELPSNFSKLINLRHLELPFDYRDVPVLKKMPKNIGKLNKLQSLPYFIVEEQHGSNIKELEKLNHLHGSIHVEGLGNVIDPADAVMANLKDKKYLEELHMNFYKKREEMNDSIVERNLSVLEAFQPNSNLKRLTIVNYNGNSFPNWLRGCDLPNLVSLKLKNCPKLEECLCHEGYLLLKKLYISDCPELKISIPKGDGMIKLHLERCDRILVNELPTSLKKFVLLGNRYTEFSVEDFSTSLDFSVTLDLHHNDSLSIKGWHSSSFPFSLHHFTNLKSLYLYDCPQLESFPRGGLPSNLRELEISKCPKLIDSREEWGLFQLNSLKWFTISDHEFENVESFPEENLLPPTLKYLDLFNCSKLRIMNNKGFLHLNSLKYLTIVNCPSLESLPEEGLQQLSSLFSLWIDECPIIMEKYKKEGRERLDTIRHIPIVRINGYGMRCGPRWIEPLDLRRHMQNNSVRMENTIFCSVLSRAFHSRVVGIQCTISEMFMQ
ncbi:unnamed protein product [Trifolium pratense]|uniref:Uncharacterized protein n=1 Tax=Trifolium pratense TaxID=57577 RepID=A0ACB0J465_TRIPR|nr:unnamed protein product [Trifolium pratense]